MTIGSDLQSANIVGSPERSPERQRCINGRYSFALSFASLWKETCRLAPFLTRKKDWNCHLTNPPYPCVKDLKFRPGLTGVA